MSIRRTAALAMAIVGGGVLWLLTMPASAQPVQRCDGVVATIVGTNGDDVIRGTLKKDVIVGLNGNDRILGLNGNDIICGGKGRDIIAGGSGKDKLFGGTGNDRISGGSAADTIDGAGGNDRLFGSGGDDTIIGGTGRDRIFGEGGTDSCTIDTDDEVRQTCEQGNYKAFQGTGDTIVQPALANSFVVVRHCLDFVNRCDPYFVAEISLDGANAFDALGVQAFNAAGDLIASYGDAGDSYGGVFMFREKPAAIEIDSGGGPWSITFVKRSGVKVVSSATATGAGNHVYMVKSPLTGVVTASATWSGFGNFAVIGVSPAEGRDLIVNEVRFADRDTPPFSDQAVAKSGVSVVQVLSDAGDWSVELSK